MKIQKQKIQKQIKEDHSSYENKSNDQNINNNSEIDNENPPEEDYGDLGQEGICLQCSKSVCRVQTTENEGSGVLVKFLKNGQERKFLVTSDKILTQSELNSGSCFNIYFNTHSSPKEISADYTKKFVWCSAGNNIKSDISLVEIKKENILDECFLEVDFNNDESYLNANIISVEEPKQEEPVVVLQGSIVQLLNDGYSFLHNAYSDGLTLGAPIINLNNQKVIGIYTGIENGMCKATFLNNIFNRIDIP